MFRSQLPAHRGNPIRRALIVGVALLGTALALPISTFAATIVVSKVHDDPNGDGTLSRGQTLTYTITIENTGATDARVDVNDPIPSGVDFVTVIDDGGGTVVTTTPILRITGINVPFRGSTTVVFSVVENGTTPSGGDICNVATVDCPPDPPVVTAPACVKVIDPPVTVVVTKFHDDPNGDGTLNRGQTLTYTVLIDNTGLTAIVAEVNDPNPAGATFGVVLDDAGGTVVTTTPTLRITGIPVAARASVTVVFTVVENGTLAGGADLCNTAVFTSPSIPIAISVGPSCVTIVDPPASVFAAKSHDDPNGDGTLTRGQTLTYTINIDNTGLTATTASVMDSIPAGATFVAVLDDAGGTVVTTTPVLQIDAIPLPARASLTVVFTVVENGTLPGGADLCNSATVVSPSLAAPLVVGPACVTVVDPALSVTASKVHDDPNANGTLNRGQTLRYTITLDNISVSAITDASVSDPIPTGATFVTVIDDGGGTVVTTTPTLQIDNIPIAARSTKMVVFDVMEDGTLPHGAVLCNSATLDTASNPVTVTTLAACITINDPGGCDPLGYTPRTLLKGVKDPGAGPNAATFSWTGEAGAVEYHLNSVTTKTDLVSPGPKQSGVGVVQCSAPVPTCSDLNALSAPEPRLYYQSLSACGPGAADEGPL